MRAAEEGPTTEGDCDMNRPQRDFINTGHPYPPVPIDLRGDVRPPLYDCPEHPCCGLGCPAEGDPLPAPPGMSDDQYPDDATGSPALRAHAEAHAQRLLVEKWDHEGSHHMPPPLLGDSPIYHMFAEPSAKRIALSTILRGTEIHARPVSAVFGDRDHARVLPATADPETIDAANLSEQGAWMTALWADLRYVLCCLGCVAGGLLGAWLVWREWGMRWP